MATKLTRAPVFPRSNLRRPSASSPEGTAASQQGSGGGASVSSFPLSQHGEDLSPILCPSAAATRGILLFSLPLQSSATTTLRNLPFLSLPWRSSAVECC
ncbi:hypothetical protein Taro_030945 [Colocasia esculenta]|uniref:Uncharacterized protein n=1 Tax=Colocasia esculenta TaxID=4460 RepID=A0A843VMP2_COLES|nr:hypothetical protein [Colocasia esculenta]